MFHFDRDTYFDITRSTLFGGKLTQQQVDGQNYILDQWEAKAPVDDNRHLAYCLATAKHETASTMWPIEEYGKGKTQPYGKPDPQTGQAYYGRGFVQLTWRDNYRRASAELGLSDENDLELHPGVALVPEVAADVMFFGMSQGWFRTAADGKPETLDKYFNATRHDAFNAREIINGDKNVVPNWSHGVSIGRLIAGYHQSFLDALIKSRRDAAAPVEPTAEPLVVRVIVPKGIEVKVEVV